MKLLTGLGLSAAVVLSLLAGVVLWLAAHALFYGLHETGLAEGSDTTAAGAFAGAVAGLFAGIVSAAGTLVAGVKSKNALPIALTVAGLWTLAGTVVGAFHIDQIHIVAATLGVLTAGTATVLAIQPKVPPIPMP